MIGERIRNREAIVIHPAEGRDVNKSGHSTGAEM
jgi:hypothetical protein